MPKEVYAHEGVTLVCTNGMHTSKMTVQDRGVTIANGKKIATEMDKPDMFSCKWAGVVMAMFAAFMIAAPFVVGILLAFIIGMIGAFTVGRYMCKIILSMSSKWLMPHNTVKIKGQQALIENSELFYLTLKNKQGEWEKNDASWNKDWIVFADRSGDAIFYDKESKTIKGTINGKIFFPLSPSLATFFQVLSECMILEEEDELLPDYLDDISSVLEHNLDEDYQQGYMQFFFG